MTRRQRPSARRPGRPPRHPLPPPTERADAIIDAALSAFAHGGYADTGMDDIASSCRMTKPTIYQYFSSKAELFEAVVDRERNALVELLRETYTTTVDLDLRGKVRTDTGAFVRWACEHRDSFTLLFLTPSPKTGLSQRTEIQAHVTDALVDSMEKFLTRHGRPGGGSLDVLANMAISSAFGAVMASQHLLPEHAETVIDLAAGFIGAGFGNIPAEAIAEFDHVSATREGGG
ncbi:TetR/AcrR family transcriptional regulator [Haloechinothrix sp. LS1_15]|uniref:TetR/AcrR family transcriptional regulator n=1 Tax=Haloechinothrix sp. LS1_15 TaxID=2652248 RepID=UPI00294B7EA1|nr:TetR/AcrR family transcriptional regulator [Haloechinothrix sp. LS1_15]